VTVEGGECDHFISTCGDVSEDVLEIEENSGMFQGDLCPNRQPNDG
jgi:hypothetical protein